MNESTTKTTSHFTPAASLAALGVKLKHLDFFGPIRQRVQIAQKTVKYTPIDKLYDGFISLLAGAHGLGEINSRLRADPGLQMANGAHRLCGTVGGPANAGCVHCNNGDSNGASNG